MIEDFNEQDIDIEVEPFLQSHSTKVHLAACFAFYSLSQQDREEVREEGTESLLNTLIPLVREGLGQHFDQCLEPQVEDLLTEQVLKRIDDATAHQ